jgi:hypothetical protein
MNKIDNSSRSALLTEPQFKFNQQGSLIQRVIVHQFTLHDVDDPSLYAAVPLNEWEQSQAGQWVIEHSVQPPTWVRSTDMVTYGCKFIILAWFTEPDYLFFKLKFK